MQLSIIEVIRDSSQPPLGTLLLLLFESCLKWSRITLGNLLPKLESLTLRVNFDRETNGAKRLSLLQTAMECDKQNSKLVENFLGPKRRGENR